MRLDETNTKVFSNTFQGRSDVYAVKWKNKEGKSVFLNISNGLEAYPDQGEFLKTIKRITEEQFDYLISE